MSNANNGAGGGGGGGAGGGSFIPNGIWITPAPTQQSFTITVGGGGAGASVGGDLSGSTTPIAEIKKNKDGCSCKKCKEHYPYAEPNQKDGTLICYACRMRW